MNEFYAPSLKELLDGAEAKHGGAVFIRYMQNGNQTAKTYAELREDCNALCRYFRSTLENKTHIAVVGKTSYEYLVYFSGILLSGNVGIPFPPDTDAEEAADLFCRADIDVLVCDSGFLPTAEKIKKLYSRPLRVLSLDDEEFNAGIYENYSSSSRFAPLSDIEVDKDECAVIVYTSGTTGVKKGVMLSTTALIGNITYKDYSPEMYGEDSLSLSVLPMYHVYCFSGDYIKNLKDGVQMCLNGDLKDLPRNLTLFQPKIMRVVPLMAQSLMQRIKITERKNPALSPRGAAEAVFGKNIEWIISGGAYLNPDLVREYEKYGITVRQGYGMTEAGCRISIPDRNADIESVGRVNGVCTVRCQNGEIQVLTPTKMLGYYKMPEESAEMFTPDGWLKTGDIGYVTDDGQIFVSGRVKNLIILSNGENVSPEAIEKRYSEMPLVAEVLVYGENDRITAEIYPDYAYAESAGISDLEAEAERITDAINSRAGASHAVANVKIRTVPFEKTGAGKIKRKTEGAVTR